MFLSSLRSALLFPGLAFGQSQDLWSLHLSSNFSLYPAALALLLVTPVLAAQGWWHQEQVERHPHCPDPIRATLNFLFLSWGPIPRGLPQPDLG